MSDTQTSFERHKEHMTAMSLGSIITGEYGRDAVHIAVLPMVGTDKLWPGYHVAVIDGKAVNFAEVKMQQQMNNRLLGVEPVGIVDPFLMEAVERGQRFWLFLYPGSITSLRHEWTHPAFEKATPAATPAINEDEKWIREYADQIDVGYRDLMQSAAEWLDNEDYMVRGGTLEGVSTRPEFWERYERVTGKSVAPDQRQNFFSCSC